MKRSPDNGAEIDATNDLGTVREHQRKRRASVVGFQDSADLSQLARDGDERLVSRRLPRLQMLAIVLAT